MDHTYRMVQGIPSGRYSKRAMPQRRAILELLSFVSLVLHHPDVPRWVDTITVDVPGWLHNWSSDQRVAPGKSMPSKVSWSSRRHWSVESSQGGMDWSRIAKTCSRLEHDTSKDPPQPAALGKFSRQTGEKHDKGTRAGRMVSSQEFGKVV
jgi:hypothetical protein